MRRFASRVIALLLAIFVLLSPANSFSQVLPYTPPAGSLVTCSIRYDLPTLKGIRFNKDNPFKFTFFFNKSDLRLTEGILKEEAARIAKYFLAALALDGNDLWVNLSPYEPGRIISDKLGRTELGQDMLGEDYVLKQLAASLTHPDTPAGRAYWHDLQNLKSQISNLRSKEQSEFQKVWIVPDKIRIYESPDMVVIDYAKLKVLCESDYKSQISNFRSAQNADAFKRHILPLIEKEVNEGKQFAYLRQLYSAVILARWFKDKLKDTVLNSAYFNKGKVRGSDCDDPAIKDKIYAEYLKAFEQGAYRVAASQKIRNKVIRREYFSGGVALKEEDRDRVTDAYMVSTGEGERQVVGLPFAQISTTPLSVKSLPRARQDSGEFSPFSVPPTYHVTVSDEDAVFAIKDPAGVVVRKETVSRMYKRQYKEAQDARRDAEQKIENRAIPDLAAAIDFYLPTKPDNLVARADEAFRQVQMMGEYHEILPNPWNPERFREQTALLVERFSRTIFMNLLDAVNVGYDAEMTADQLADTVRAIGLSQYNTEAKFVIYSGPPGSGKDGIWGGFANRYPDLCSRLILFHTRDMRPGEENGKTYHFRTKEHLEALEKENYIITADVNNQLQGLAIQTFDDDYIGIAPGKLKPGSGTSGKINVTGLDSVFTGDKIVVLECGLNWFKKLEEQYGHRILSFFVFPFELDYLNKVTEDVRHNPAKAIDYVIGLKTALAIYAQDYDEATRLKASNMEAVAAGDYDAVNYFSPLAPKEFDAQLALMIEHTSSQGVYDSFVATMPPEPSQEGQTVRQGGLDLRDFSYATSTPSGLGMNFDFDEAVSFLNDPDFSGLAANVESVSLR